MSELEPKVDQEENDEWELWWNARVAAMETVLGKCHDMVGHGVVPFQFGADAGGAPDMVYFHHHLDGIVTVTCELIGCEEQIPSKLGEYELMICHRNNEAWGPDMISRLAHYTLETPLNPGETMDIGPATPEGSTIEAFLFVNYAKFKVRKRKAGLLLCIGITTEELQACRSGRRKKVEAALKKSGVYPFTDFNRESVI